MMSTLPPWAERTDGGGVRCDVCGAESEELPLDHDCIYANDLVADGGQPTDESGTYTSGTDRSGELERFALECALRNAWTTEFWIPADPDYGFVDYFEAAATRNLGLLAGVEELAEDIDRRGIVRQSDSEQARLVTDGGSERRDPAEDPRSCSRCGVHIGFLGDDYCEPCAREIGARPPIVRCMHCGQDGPQEQMESVDMSTEDEYYPTIRYLCRDCSGGESA